jgi:putative holliday junction resolvase
MDIGRRRIGLAISDPSGTLARPLQTLERGPSDRRTLRDLAAIVSRMAADEDGLGLVVVGLPVRLDGSPTELTPHVLEMVAGLRRRLGVPLALQDERLSSHEAEARLAVNERDWRVRKARVDMAAAAVILQDYLDAHRTEEHGSTVPPEDEA